MSAPRATRAPTPLTSSRAAARPHVAAHAAASSAHLELLLACAGLFICTGLPEAVAPGGFRWLKHAFYAWIAALLLLRGRASLRVALRDPALCLFAALLLSSALWSELPVWAFKRGAVMVQTTLFGLYLASRFAAEQQLRALAYVMAVVVAALGASALLDPANAFATPGHPGAFRGPLVHKNQVAQLMALAIPVLWLRAWIVSRERLVLLPALAAACVLLALSRSLGGTLVAALLCALLAARRLAGPRRAWALLLPVLLVVLGAAAAAAGLVDALLVAVGKDPTLTGRTQIWENSARLLSERPLLGHSMASFWQRDIVARTGVWFSNAHNGYLQLLIDLGIVGLATFAIQLLGTVSRSLAFARRPDPAAVWPFCIAAFVLVYNLIEVSVVAENSIVWVLYVAASLAVRSHTPRAVGA